VAEPTLHSLDLRVTKLEGQHKTAEETVMLKLGALIDEKLDKRFGWVSRTWQAVLQAVFIAIVLYLLGVPGG
jgi:hypothetical protein